MNRLRTLLTVDDEEGFPDGVSKVKWMEKYSKKLSRYGLMK
jgi:hypothetical protein